MKTSLLIVIFSMGLATNVYSMKKVIKLKNPHSKVFGAGTLSPHIKDIVAKRKDTLSSCGGGNFHFHKPGVEKGSIQDLAWIVWHNARTSFEARKGISFKGEVIDSSIIPLQSYKIVRYAHKNRKKEILEKDDFINELGKYYCPGDLHNFEDKELIIAAKKKHPSSIVTAVTITDEDTNCVLFMHSDPTQKESQYCSAPAKGHDFLIHTFIEQYHRPGSTKTSLTLVCPGKVRQRGPWNLLVPAADIQGHLFYISDEYIRNLDISFKIITHGAEEEKNKQSHNVKLIIRKAGAEPEIQAHFVESMEYPLDYFFTDRIRAINERKLELGYIPRNNKKLQKILTENAQLQI